MALCWVSLRNDSPFDIPVLVCVVVVVVSVVSILVQLGHAIWLCGVVPLRLLLLLGFGRETWRRQSRLRVDRGVIGNVSLFV